MPRVTGPNTKGFKQGKTQRDQTPNDLKRHSHTISKRMRLHYECHLKYRDIGPCYNDTQPHIYYCLSVTFIKNKGFIINIIYECPTIRLSLSVCITDTILVQVRCQFRNEPDKTKLQKYLIIFAYNIRDWVIGIMTFQCFDPLVFRRSVTFRCSIRPLRHVLISHSQYYEHKCFLSNAIIKNIA